MKFLNRWIISPREAARLREENERLHTLLSGAVDRETVLKFINYEEGGALTIGVSPPQFARKFLAVLFAEALGDAENFQTGSFEWKAGEYEMTIRRIYGKSTAQVLTELKAEIEALKKERPAA
jgi:hypothetical protein